MRARTEGLRWRIALSALAALLAAGCGQHNDIVAPAPTVSELLDSAWARYARGEFEAAEATFDSAIVLDAYNAEAYLGNGFSAGAQNDYNTSRGSYSVCVTLGGKNVLEETVGDTIVDSANVATFVDTTGYWAAYGIWRFRMFSAPGALLGFSSFKRSFLDLNVIGIDDQWIYVQDPLPTVFGDTTGLLQDTFHYAYTYTGTDSVSALTWFAYVGNASAYVAEGTNLMRGVVFGRAADKSQSVITDVLPTRAANALPFDLKTARLLTAVAFFRNEMYPSAVAALHQIDPAWPVTGWSMGVPADVAWAMDADNFDEILSKIETELGI